jgi:hypothetical protein
MKTKIATRTYPRTVTPETIADARAWLLEAAEIDGIAPTPENLRALANEHATVLRGGAFGVLAESLIQAVA